MQKAIRRGESLQAQYCAAELDLSGWGNAAWIRLLVVTCEDIGLAHPGAPALVVAAYEAWLDAIAAHQGVSRSKLRRAGSHGAPEARRVLMTCVDQLARMERSRMLSFASGWAMFDSDGALPAEAWAITDDALPDALRGRLAFRLGPPLLPAEAQAASALAAALAAQDELLAIRCAFLLLQWGQRALAWEIIGWCAALAGVSSQWVATLERLHTSPPAGQSCGLFFYEALCGVCRPHLLPGPDDPAPGLDDALIARWYRPTLRRPEVPDWALDKHTMRGARMGRGLAHFFEVGALCTRLAARVADPYQEDAMRGYFEEEAARSTSKARTVHVVERKRALFAAGRLAPPPEDL